MRRREFITLLGGAAVWPITADAQHTDSGIQVNIVGVIAPPFTAVDALGQGFRELGYLEGQNLRLVYRWVEGSIEQYAAVVFELIKLGAAVVVVYGTPAATICVQRCNVSQVSLHAASGKSGHVAFSLNRKSSLTNAQYRRASGMLPQMHFSQSALGDPGKCCTCT